MHRSDEETAEKMLKIKKLKKGIRRMEKNKTKRNANTFDQLKKRRSKVRIVTQTLLIFSIQTNVAKSLKQKKVNRFV